MAQTRQMGSRGIAGARRLPFDAGERKKMMILAGLAIVCAVVVLPQLLKSKGPAAAMAGVPDAGATPALDLESTLQQMRADGLPSKGPRKQAVLFDNVDDALEVFVGGARPKSVPMSELGLDVFGVPALQKASEKAAALAGGSDAGGKATPEKTGVDPITALLAKVTLETVLKSSHNCAAIIDGQVLHVGEKVGPLTITRIETGKVTLELNKTLYTLVLKE